ncbi:MAG: TetR/AcrR family transcriptional regulator [Hyphomonadaceae bacterium]
MILEVADRVFGRDGEAGLSIRRLADEIDYSPGAIYKYFNSKQELMNELKEMFFERLLEELPVFDDETGDYPLFVRSSLETYMRVALEAPHHYEAAFSGEAEPMPALLDTSPTSAKERAFFHLFSLIGDGIERGDFAPEGAVLQVAKSVWAACHGLVILMIHFQDFGRGFGAETGADTGPDAVIARHADFLIKGMSV